jgi:type VI secretion system secreted protein VgrG
MPEYTQKNRPLSINTPQGEDAFLISGFRGHEAISQPFRFELELLAQPSTELTKLIGQPVTVTMRVGAKETRYFHGLISRFTQGARGERFIRCRAEMVPQLWVLNKKVRSRIFQHLSVPDILEQVLAGLKVRYDLTGTYKERDYCVQYRESDMAFVSRLMEEEGIYYYFEHADSTHTLVVSDNVGQYPAIVGQNTFLFARFEAEATLADPRITAWEKTQEIRSGAYTLRDHCFELPEKDLEAHAITLDEVKVGKAQHKLKVGGNDQLELYDFPGGYAQRFDGIDASGGDRPNDLQNIFQDKDRTVRIRMEQEEVEAIKIDGKSNCAIFASGYTFVLSRHYDADDKYLLTRVEHNAKVSNYETSEQDISFEYTNSFTCIPATVAYRPQRVTPKPIIAGNQTATVVGRPGDDVFTDKYGRIKVQFHWDREGKKDAASSCWVRVAQIWAGAGWGAFFWPRIDHEVVVVFEEGDPDQPLIVGSVYNAANMPPYPLPQRNKVDGIKSESVRGGANEHFNALLFFDETSHEHLALYSERHMSVDTEFDTEWHCGRHKSECIPGVALVTVGGLPKP